MKELTKEHFERLKPYEPHLNRAVKGNYVYGLTRPIFNELSAVYRDLGYTKRLDYSCANCQLDLCKTLGRLYFAYKEKLNTDGYGVKDEGLPYPESAAQFDGEPNDDPNGEPTEEENPDFTESHTPTKTNNTKAKKTNTKKKTK